MSAQGGTASATAAQTLSGVQSTEYVVFEHVDLPPTEALGPPELHAWREVARVTARDTTQAIREYLKNASEIDSQFVATPARSWKPVSVKTKIALDFGEAS